MTKQEVKRFLINHRNLEISAAKMEYSLHLHKDAASEMYELMNRYSLNNNSETFDMSIIETASTAEEIVRLLRREVSISIRSRIIEKAIEMEEETLPLIQKRALTSRQDIFIENAVKFFLQCKTNCCDWILKEYKSFRSQYLKSMLCLVLGFRGDVSMIDFLISEAERFESEYPDESFDQGPALAVNELAVRFLS